MLYGSHAKAANRRHWGAMCSVCVGRAVRCACVAPKPKARQVFSLTRSRLLQKRTAHRAPASACCSSRQSTRWCHRCCICTLPTLRRVTLPVFTAASMAVNRRHRGALCSVCVGRAVRCACVAPEPTARRLLFALTGRVCSKQKQHKEHPRQHAVVVDKAHGGVIDVASAPCQPSAAWLCRPSPQPRVGMGSPQRSCLW